MNERSSSLAQVVVTAAKPGHIMKGSFSEKGLGGPKTAIGKRRSSRNALKAGLYTSATIVRGESEAEYVAFARTVVAGLDVQNGVEMAIAERLVSALWRARRARRFETAHLNIMAMKVERLQKELADAEEELARCEREEDAVSRIAYPASLSSELLWTASDGIIRVAKDYLDANALRDAESVICEAIPSRKRATKAMVAEFGFAVRDALQLLFKNPMQPSSTLLWARNELSATAKGLGLTRHEATRKHHEARAWASLLPDKIGFRESKEYSREAGAAKALADGESRLDRQVSRALSDFKVARELRNDGNGVK